MHWTLLVTLSKHHASASEAARRHVYETLRNLPLFVDEDGFGLCDWFVIGGRASGMLTTVRTDHAPEKEPTDRILGSGLVVRAPWTMERDPYRDLGYEDDAMPVDRVLYETLLKRHEGVIEAARDGVPVYRDLAGDRVCSAFVGGKWLVVVDCHS